MSGPRALDHLVLPTASLAVARRSLSQLGFTVAPDGVHPFGTTNCCVYLADGTFLEPLAIGDTQAVYEVVQAGNSFVVGDRRFREACGDEGLSALVLASADAESDAVRFERLGIAGGPSLAFSRPSVDMAGRADTASFLLAFAAHASAPDLHFFACERRRAPAIDRGRLHIHANGVQSVRTVHATAARPTVFAEFLSRMADGALVSERQDGADVMLANCRIAIEADPQSTRLTGITFAVTDLATTTALLLGNDIAFEQIAADALTVRARAGQGADFTFQEAQ